MIKDLQDLFKRSWDAFRAEVERRDPEDRVAELLTGMKREIVTATALLPEIADAAQRVEKELARERQGLADCERRGALAERIGDGETAQVAGEFAERHRARIQVLEQKLEATRAEHALRTTELTKMKNAYRKAESQRFALLAQLRTQQAKSRIHGANDELWQTFGRMESEIDTGSHYADALDDLADEGSPQRPPRTDVDDRLAELKRRMGK
jgi:phage shock protein A